MIVNQLIKLCIKSMTNYKTEFYKTWVMFEARDG